MPLKIVYRNAEALTPYAGNARTHSAEQVAQIARSIEEFGWTNPILVDGDGGVIAGHGRLMAAKEMGIEKVPTITVAGLTEAQKRALVIADNKLALNAGWDERVLAAELAELATADFDLSLLGFSEFELDGLTGQGGGGLAVDPDDSPSPPEEPVSQPGDLWLLGRHRLLCGDSVNTKHVARLMGDSKGALLHADPPYGMGKAADGVANDNLYRDKLDAFQMAWWRAFRPHLLSNASAYVWGNAPDLWRLWYCGGLADSETLEFRNEIVWDKKAIAGMASPELTQYPEASERCLFFQFGNQFLGNINADDFPEAWEPLRSYLDGEAEAAGLSGADVKRICGCGMFSHWFTRSQFTLIPDKHYASIRAAYPDRFQRPWPELKAEWDRVKGSGRLVINGKLEGRRSYFDNAHDTMRDVWEFPRVTGDERHDHATPKPVAMMERAITSSCPDGFIVVEPFAGSGSTLIAAERCKRACFAMELQARYVDVTVRRWQLQTGLQATLEGDGRTFDEIAAEREAVPA